MTHNLNSNQIDIHTDIFGSVRMGYMVIQSEKFSQWRTFLREGLGINLAFEDETLQAYRIDDYARRFIIKKGPAEDVEAIGYEVTKPNSLAVILARLKDRTISVRKLIQTECELRGVKEAWQVIGPKGLRVEFYHEARKSEGPLDMLASGFYTGHSGLGHIAMVSRLPAKAQRFWQEIFDARYSDHIEQKMSPGIVLDINFLRLNERHHSIAVAAVRDLRLDPIRTKIQHVNIEAMTMDDLTKAYHRCIQLGFEIAHGIGQHSNDCELSFYVVSPSGFEFEFGWDPIRVNESTWCPDTYNRISTWGHKSEGTNAMANIFTEAGLLLRGATSLLKPEYNPLARGNDHER